jgi:hypothetical protein
MTTLQSMSQSKGRVLVNRATLLTTTRLACLLEHAIFQGSGKDNTEVLIGLMKFGVISKAWQNTAVHFCKGPKQETVTFGCMSNKRVQSACLIGGCCFNSDHILFFICPVTHF